MTADVVLRAVVDALSVIAAETDVRALPAERILAAGEDLYSDDYSLGVLGFDSISVLMALVSLDEVFGVFIVDDDLDYSEIQTVGGLVAYIMKRIGMRAG